MQFLFPSFSPFPSLCGLVMTTNFSTYQVFFSFPLSQWGCFGLCFSLLHLLCLFYQFCFYHFYPICPLPGPPVNHNIEAGVGLFLSLQERPVHSVSSSPSPLVFALWVLGKWCECCQGHLPFKTLMGTLRVCLLSLGVAWVRRFSSVDSLSVEWSLTTESPSDGEILSREHTHWHE